MPAQDSHSNKPVARRFYHSFIELLESNAQFVSSESKVRRVHAIAERVISLSLLMYAAFAPHSIAITQSAFLLGLAAWTVQMIAARNLRIERTPVDIALLGFFACCVISSFLSYEPLTSIKGLRSPAFFLAFYFVSSKVRSLRFATALAFLIIFSSLISVTYSAKQVAVGRGIRIESLREDSPLAGKDLRIGDVIIEADGQRVDTKEELYRIISSVERGPVQIQFQRSEAVLPAYISRRDLNESEGEGADKLGITTSTGRNIRVTGFYSHYETYAEVLQLIAALAIGLFIARPDKRSRTGVLLGAVIALLTATLIMTSTRAAMIGLTVAVAAMALMTLRRRTMVVSVFAILLIAPLALFAVERSRGISVFDPEEGSSAYRLEVWREAFFIIKDHPAVGIGKGSEGGEGLRKRYKLYSEGKLPPGHFHSTPIQIATWWGLPALIFYSAMMVMFAIEIFRLGRMVRVREQWKMWGIALGTMGALLAFNVSSVVHFNFGDGEVVMAFWLMVGLAFAVRKIALGERDDSQSKQMREPPSEYSSQKSPRQEREETSEASVRAARARQN